MLLSILNPDSAAAAPTPFWVADAVFGVMLLLLAASSLVWHASNAVKSQYVVEVRVRVRTNFVCW